MQAIATNVDKENVKPRKVAKSNTNTLVHTASKEIIINNNLSSTQPMSQIGSNNNISKNSILSESSMNIINNLPPTQPFSQVGVKNVMSNESMPPKHRKKIIQAIDTNVFTVRRHIVETNCQEFSVKQASPKAPVKITINNENEVETVRNALKQGNLSFHEFKWDDEKSKCFIIRGLVGIDESCLPDVKHELVSAGLPANIVLSMHVTGYMRANPQIDFNIPVKMVVPPNFDEKMLLKIKYLNHVVVRFEAFKSNSVIQCKNCQRFGHSAGGCQHMHRCVKCGLNHFRDDCPRTLNQHHKLKCCNCNGEHTANNLTMCNYFQQNFAAKKSLSNKIRVNHSKANNTLGANNSTRKSGVSYASILKNNSPNDVGRAPDFNPEVSASGDWGSKLDMIFQLVLKHEKLLTRFLGNE